MEQKRNYLAGIAELVIILIVALAVGENKSNLVPAYFKLLLLLLMVNLTGYAIPTLLNRPRAQRKTLSLEVGMQNAGLGTVLALKYFRTEAATRPQFTPSSLHHFW